MSLAGGTMPERPEGERSCGEPRLELLGGFRLTRAGSQIRLPLSVQRLLAFVAIHPRPVQRSYVAGALWPDGAEQRSLASLRSALWRLQSVGNRPVHTIGTALRLGDNVEVDLREWIDWGRRIVHGGPQVDDIAVALASLRCDLLPDWADDWVLMERERFRQLRLHALEALAEGLTSQGRHREAVEAAIAAVTAEPLRESAQRVLIRAYLAEGNSIEAIRQYRSFSRLLATELGLDPSPGIRTVVAGLPID